MQADAGVPIDQLADTVEVAGEAEFVFGGSSIKAMASRGGAQRAQGATLAAQFAAPGGLPAHSGARSFKQHEQQVRFSPLVAPGHC